MFFKKRDLNFVIDKIRQHESNSKKFIQLIASENSLSDLSKKFLSSDLAFRYALGRPNERSREVGGWYFPNTSNIDEIEKIADDCMKKLFYSKFNDFRPISGTTCFASVMFSFLNPKDCMMKISYENGGHGATEKFAKKMNIDVCYLVYDNERFVIDVEKSVKKMEKHRPKLVILDGSKILFPHPLKELSESVPEDTLISYDGSHVLGLIAGKTFQDPLKEGANILHGSTHKSFPGPQRGIIATRSKELNEKINDTVSYTISNHHLNSMVALAISLLEMEKFGERYARQIIKNSKSMAQCLHEYGFKVLGEKLGFTETHQIMLDTSNFIDPFAFTQTLEKGGIMVNKCMLPFVNKPGIRIGVQEMTRFGMRENEIKEIANLIYKITVKKESPEKIANEVRELRSSFVETKFGFHL